VLIDDILQLYNKPSHLSLRENIQSLVTSNAIINPDVNNIFDAFKIEESNLKIVIIGQDPYTTLSIADGLAFSTRGNYLSPSLKNIFKEVQRSTGIQNNSTNLVPWKSQGVLLYNVILTSGTLPLSHMKLGWLEFSKDVINYLNNKYEFLVFLLWGNFAKRFKKYLNPYFSILEASHPSPLGSIKQPFVGNNCFAKANEILKSHNLEQIEWRT
jgi:uracil-DNA glycosylase